jgi:hypothetical protein
MEWGESGWALLFLVTFILFAELDFNPMVLLRPAVVPFCMMFHGVFPSI